MSKHTLISFLGKSKLNQQTGYRKANYDFGNGILKEVSFFGIGLTEVLKPHKLILIGTAGSMWDVFFDHHTPENEQVLNLVDAVAESRVDESLLTSCEEEIGRMLGCEVKCLIIDYAGNEAEQIHLLSQIAEQLEEGEESAWMLPIHSGICPCWHWWPLAFSIKSKISAPIIFIMAHWK